MAGPGRPLTVRMYRVAELSNDPANARQHYDEDITALQASLRRFGQLKNIVVDKHRVVRAGNGLLEAARREGWDEIAGTDPPEMSETELTAFALADNRTAELSRWNYEIVSAQLKALQADGFPVEHLGWDAGDLQNLLNAEWGPPPEGEMDSGPPPQAKPIVVTVEQRAVIEQAIAHVRASEDDPDIPEGRAVELICADYLSGAPDLEAAAGSTDEEWAVQEAMRDG